MENVTKEILEEITKGYREMGVSQDKFFVGGKVKNIFDFLDISPKIDDTGRRELTPYEILGILPNIVNGKEKPIVFFVRNKIINLKPIKTSEPISFSFFEETNKKADSLVEFILDSYKTAIMQNNLAEAERNLETLNMLTGGKAKHYIGEVYDYTKFYKQMKKQLIIDLFSHFFLLYLMQKKSIIKAGLIIKNKKFKAYNANKQFEHSNNNVPQIKSIRVDKTNMEETSNEENSKSEFDDFSKFTKNEKEIVLQTKNQVVEVIKIDKPQKQKETMQKKSYIKKFINRLQRKDKNSKIDAPAIKKISEKVETLPEKEVSYE